MLRAIGFDDVVILDGALDKWIAEKRPLSTDATVFPPATLSLRARPGAFVGKEEMKAAIGTPDTLSLNALSSEQHAGTGGMVYGRAGRITGSSCVPATSLLNADKTLKPIADLRAAFDGVAATQDKRILCYCGGGIAATVDAFVLTAVLGHRNVGVYDNSLQEWANDPGLPMERD
jgi:thiosulfate/3-mercaptopyruvate sulfurtransferase